MTLSGHIISDQDWSHNRYVMAWSHNRSDPDLLLLLKLELEKKMLKIPLKNGLIFCILIKICIQF